MKTLNYSLTRKRSITVNGTRYKILGVRTDGKLVVAMGRSSLTTTFLVAGN